MKKCDTTKLFYDEYPYKIVVVNGLAAIFRDMKYTYSKEVLDDLQHKAENGDQLYISKFNKREIISSETFSYASKIYACLTDPKAPKHKLRIEHPHMQIYSNDYDWLKTIGKKINAIEIWEPNADVAPLLDKNVVVTKTKPPFPIRVTLGSECDPSFADWIMNNSDKAWAGYMCLENIKSYGYARGMYFYVRDEKVLSLITLFVKKFARVDKIIYIENIDK